MMYRLARRQFVEAPNAPFDGMGAYYAGNRWNSAGRRASYAASSESLATLEYLAHATSNLYFIDVVLVVAQIPDDHVEPLGKPLPPDWRTTPAPLSTVGLGDAWLDGMTAAAMTVPSVIVPRENNVVVNPMHPGAAAIQVKSIEPWTIDDRLRPEK